MQFAQVEKGMNKTKMRPLLRPGTADHPISPTNLLLRTGLLCSSFLKRLNATRNGRKGQNLSVTTLWLTCYCFVLFFFLVSSIKFTSLVYPFGLRGEKF